MENNNEKPKTPFIPGNGSPDPLAPAENNSGISNEVDIDDALHTEKPIASEEEKQQDGDEAVHENYTPAKNISRENDERDPDDLVHGK